MPNLFTVTTKNQSEKESLTSGEIFSIAYHDIFDYPLNLSDLIRWRAGDAEIPNSKFQIINKDGFYSLEEREGIIYKRILRERISKKKIEIAKTAARILSSVPTIKMVAATGSLAMANSTDESDIDLLIVTQKGSLWTTRLISYFLLAITGAKVRKSGDKNQKDKLCLNMWIDESDLTWQRKDRNIYSAHEIGQILPLINKNGTYEKFLQKNKWILKYWPNSVRIEELKSKVRSYKSSLGMFEAFAFWFQRRHMRSKITREVVTKTRALFHPQDWSSVVLDRLHQV